MCLPKDFRENIRVKGIMMVMEEGQCSVPADHDRMAFPSAVSPPPQSCPSLLSPLPVAPRASGARPAHTARRNCLHLLEAHHVHRPPEGGPGLPLLATCSFVFVAFSTPRFFTACSALDASAAGPTPTLLLREPHRHTGPGASSPSASHSVGPPLARTPSASPGPGTEQGHLALLFRIFPLSPLFPNFPFYPTGV